MKKKLIALSLAVIILATLGAGTLAYVTDEGIAHNVITTSGVEILLVEEMLDSSGRVVPFRDQAGIMPGNTVSKIVTVDNLQEEAWIRAAVEMALLDADGKRLNPKENPISLDLSSDWIEYDGNYYYKKPVGRNESTTPLFTEVRFSGQAMGNEFQNCSVQIGVSVQAVQSANNLPDDNSRVLTPANVSQIDGWPGVFSAILGLFK